MLRILVISLFVANLLLFGFQGSKPKAPTKTVTRQTVVEDSSIPTIHLFSELMQDHELMSGNRRCFSVGPFHSIEDRYETRALLLELSADVTVRETRALVEKGYWVYMPPYVSLLEANQVLLSLKALGLEDIAVIYDGEWKNAISLGYFLRQENALKRKKGLEDRDYAPLIRVQRQSEPRYWLDYEQNPGSGLITLDMRDRPNDFVQRSLPCLERNPFEQTASASENLVAETVQTQIPEEDTQMPPEESSEPDPEENSEPQSIEGDGEQPTEVLDLYPDPRINSAPAETDDSAPEPATETDPEVSQNLEDDPLQQPVENPVDDPLEEQVPEGVDGSQPMDDVGIDTEEIIDDAPVDGGEAVPEPASETEPKNSMGTGPVIDFGSEPEEDGETGTDSG
jgi:hypothetical protein